MRGRLNGKLKKGKGDINMSPREESVMKDTKKLAQTIVDGCIHFYRVNVSVTVKTIDGIEITISIDGQKG